MKMNRILYSLSAAALMAAGLVSCSSDEPMAGGSNETGVIQLAKAPSIKAYSIDRTSGNKHYWGATSRSTDMNANMWDQTWDCPPRPAEDLTPEELAELKALLSKGKETHNEIVLPFENYYVQQIYKGKDTYYTHDRCEQEGCDHVNSQTELGSDHMDKLVAYNPSSVFDWREEDGYQGAWYTTEYEHINNFNSGTNKNTPGACGCGESHFGTTLMTGMPTEGIDPERQFGFHETWGTAHDYNNYIIVEYKGYYYVGFDYEAHKYDQTTHNHGEGMDIERDWNFTDWIVRITPAYHKGETPENPGNGDTDDNKPGTDNPGYPTDDMCSICGHVHAEGSHCDQCEAEEGHDCASNDHFTREGYDEVEVNLAADEKDGFLESHTSIHVRCATDIEIFIPVPAAYTCDADDMAIVNDHNYGNMVHGGPYKTEYNVNGNIVTLNLEVTNDGIRIWTDGINQDVIDYCWATFGDGITFEVWNYFNIPGEHGDPAHTDLPISYEELKYLLNKATIKFLDKIPEDYINAFVDEPYNDTNTGADEFHVTPDNYTDYFEECTSGEHLNGSDNNEIYHKK